MKSFDEVDENYSSDLITDLLNKITPEEQDQIDHKMQIAKMIYMALKAKGWKNIDLAEKLKLKSPSLVSKWLSGTHNFTVETLVQLQRVLDIKLLNITPDATPTTLNVRLIVGADSSPLTKDVLNHLQKVIDDTGGLQPTTVTVKQ